jgi:hypothetical protein
MGNELSEETYFQLMQELKTAELEFHEACCRFGYDSRQADRAYDKMLRANECAKAYADRMAVARMAAR